MPIKPIEMRQEQRDDAAATYSDTFRCKWMNELQIYSILAFIFSKAKLLLFFDNNKSQKLCKVITRKS